MTKRLSGFINQLVHDLGNGLHIIEVRNTLARARVNQRFYVVLLYRPKQVSTSTS